MSSKNSLTRLCVGLTSRRFTRNLMFSLALAPLLSAAVPPGVHHPRTPAPVRPAAARPVNLPLQFEPNRGQWPARVQYFVRGDGMGMQMVSRGANLAWLSYGPGSGLAARPRTLRVMRLRFMGAPAGHWQGQNRLPGHASELVGAQRDWRSNLPVYGAVVDRNLYPGIQAQFQGRAGVMEWNLHIAPGAAPSQVRLQLTGGRASLMANGGLRLSAYGRGLRWLPPQAWQMRAGQRQSVAVRYVIRRHGQIGFQLGAYDPRHALVIDPTLSWSTYLGGAQDDQATAVATDSSGNIYLTGYTLSANFPVTTGVVQGKLTGNTNVFVSEIKPDGSALVYSTYLGGSGIDQGMSIAVDSSGDAIITGSTNSTNFPVTAGAFQTIAPAGFNAFVAKLNPTGTGLIYSTYLGGSGADNAAGVTLDNLGDAYITGSTSSSDFPVTAGVVQNHLAGAVNAFVSELNPAGSALVYSTYLGGSAADHATAIAVDSAGNAYICGYTDSANFPVTNSAFQSTLNGKFNAFVASLVNGGSSLNYSTYLGGNGDDQANALAVSSNGDVDITGFTNSTNFPTTSGVYQQVKSSGEDVFVTQFNNTGASLNYSTLIGSGSGNNIGNGIALDAQGNAYIDGSTTSPDFPVSTSTFQSLPGGATDAFLVRLDAVGATLPYATYLGGSGVDQANAITLDPSGNVILVGTTFSTNFPVTSGALQSTNAGQSDAFVMKFTTGPAGGFSSSTLSFPEQAEFTTSSPIAASFYNSGEAPLAISGITASKDYAETNNCPVAPATLAPGLSCSVSVTFTPSTTTSPDTGTLTVTDNAPGGSQTLALTGTVGTFAITSTPTQATVNPGNSTSYALTFTPANGYTTKVNLTCSGLPSGATCTFSPSSVSMSGNSNSTSSSTMSVSTTTSAGLPLAPLGPGSNQPWAWLGAGLLLLTALVLAWRQWGLSRRWVGLLVLGLLNLAAAGCGSNSAALSTPSGTYPVKISAADVNGTVIQTTTVSLVVIN